jgi:class 3 adenylate cyclase
MENVKALRTSPLSRLIDIIGNPLEWRYVNKLLLFLGIQIVVFSAFNVYARIVLTTVGSKHAFIAPSNFKVFIWINEFFVLFFIAVFICSLWLRKFNPDNRWIVYISAIAISIQDSIWSCGIGHSTNPFTFLVFFILLLTGFLFFDFYFSIIVAFSWLSVLGLHIFAEQVNLISYAWVFTKAPFDNGLLDTMWLAGGIGFGLLFVGAEFILFYYVIRKWRQRERQVSELSNLLKKMFGRYLSTEVMESLIENPAALELGGEKRRVAIMMTDLRGFTALSEKLDPEQVVQMLNSYFEVMVDTIYKYEGTINEFIGDALLVIFGAPHELHDSAQRSIGCAIEMQNAMGEVNRKNVLNGLPELEMGIGINEAEVIVGNIGSSKRSNYTAIGSGVNMASRIESCTVGGQILISESVMKAVGDQLRIDNHQEVFAKGAEHPINVYEVGGISGAYNLALREKKAALETLTRKIPIHYTIVGGKTVGDKKLDGHVTRLSKRCAEVVTGGPVKLLTNLKLNLDDVEGYLSSKDFYCKVTGIVNDEKTRIMINFTSIPPEVSSYFLAFRKYAKKDNASPDTHGI